MPDGDNILALWIGLMCHGMKSGRVGVVEVGDGIPFTSETLATEFDLNINTVKLGLETFQRLKMIEIWENGELFLLNFEKHQELTKIEKAKVISRLSSQKYREKLKLNSDVTVTEGDETEEEKIRIEKEKELLEEFNKFWIIYDFKKDRKKCFSKWKKLKPEEKEKIFETLPDYVENTIKKESDNKSKEFIPMRKNPATYLNNDSWEDEIIKYDKKSNKDKPDSIGGQTPPELPWI